MRASERPELHLGRAAVLFLGILAVPMVGGGALVGGAPVAAGAAVGIGLVAILFGLTGVMQTRAAAHGPSVLAVATWIGVGVRLALYASVLALVGRLEWLHRPSVAIATGIAFTATLGYEMWVVGRTPGLFWVRVVRNDAGGVEA